MLSLARAPPPLPRRGAELFAENITSSLLAPLPLSHRVDEHDRGLLLMVHEGAGGCNEVCLWNGAAPQNLEPLCDWLRPEEGGTQFARRFAVWPFVPHQENRRALFS